MTDDRTDLIQYCDQADELAFERIVNRYWNMVWATCHRTGASEPEDAAQAVFLVLAMRASSLTKRRNIAGFLYETARRVSWQQNRSQTARKQREQAASKPTMATSTNAELIDSLQTAMDKLGQRDRTAIILRHVLGYSEAEVAAKLGVSETAAASRLTRARAKLRRILADPHFTGTHANVLGIASLAIPAAPVETLNAQAHLLSAGMQHAHSAIVLAQETTKAIIAAKAKVYATTAAIALLLSSACWSILYTTGSSILLSGSSAIAAEPLVNDEASGTRPIPGWVKVACLESTVESTAQTNALQPAWHFYHLLKSKHSGPVICVGTNLNSVAPPSKEEQRDMRNDLPRHGGLPYRYRFKRVENRYREWARKPAHLVAPKNDAYTYIIWNGPLLTEQESCSPYALFKQDNIITLVVDTWEHQSETAPAKTAAHTRPVLITRFTRLAAGPYSLRIVQRRFTKVVAGNDRQLEVDALSTHRRNRHDQENRQAWLAARQAQHVHNTIIDGQTQTRPSNKAILDTYSLESVQWGDLPFTVSEASEANKPSYTLETLSEATALESQLPVPAGRIPLRQLTGKVQTQKSNTTCLARLTGHHFVDRWLADLLASDTTNPEFATGFSAAADDKVTLMLWQCNDVVFTVKDVFYTQPDHMTIRIDAWKKPKGYVLRRPTRQVFELLNPVATSGSVHLQLAIDRKEWNQESESYVSTGLSSIDSVLAGTEWIEVPGSGQGMDATLKTYLATSPRSLRKPVKAIDPLDDF